MPRGNKAKLGLPEPLQTTEVVGNLDAVRLHPLEADEITVELTGNNTSVRRALLFGLENKASNMHGGVRKTTLLSNKTQLNSFLNFLDSSAYATTSIENLPGDVLNDWERQLNTFHNSRTTYQYVANVSSILRHYAFYYAVHPNLYTRLKTPTTGDVGVTSPIPALDFFVEAQVLKAVDTQITDSLQKRAAIQNEDLTESAKELLQDIVAGNDIVRTRTNYRKAGPGGFLPVYAKVYIPGQEILPFYIKLALITGWEPSVLRDLSRNCLGKSNGHIVEVQLTKYRRHNGVQYTSKILDGGLETPGGLIRAILNITKSAYQKTPSDSLWLGLNAGTLKIKTFDFSKETKIWERFCTKNNIQTQDGKLAVITSRMLRKTFKMHRYNDVQGSLVDFVDGHSPETAVRHYATLPQLTQTHEKAIANGVQALITISQNPPEGGEETWFASCHDTKKSPFSPVGQTCTAVPWTCFACPNSIVSSVNLPAIVAFIQETTVLKTEMGQKAWDQRFAQAYNVITFSILPQFDNETLAGAKEKAEHHPVKLLIRSLKDGDLT